MTEITEKQPGLNEQHYYGISLTVDTQLEESDKLIFTEQGDVLKTVKKYNGSRFKIFDSLEAAETFSLQRTPVKEKNTQDVERMLNPFSSPHSRDMTKLRRAIEKGDCALIDEIIWSNPRYLVSPGDTPAILMEGPRYNACHIAAKSSQDAALKTILDAITKVEFMKLVYPFDTQEITVSRINFLLDLYLNTPDKGAFETPLHFASKFGASKVVELLLSHRGCDITKENKLGQKASDIICQRKGSDEDKKKIETLLSGKRKHNQPRVCRSLELELDFEKLTLNDSVRL